MLGKVELSDFRNYRYKEIDLSRGINLIVGENATGKTNLLEAVYLLANGESFRAKKTEEMVLFEKEFGRVRGEVVGERDTVLIEVMISGGTVIGKKVNKRKFFLDGVPRRKQDVLGIMPVVLFRPEDVEIISGAPDIRRKVLDRLLSQVDREYASSLSTYDQALRRRNKVLDAIREGSVSQYSLTFWDGLLIKHGQLLQDRRRMAVSFINDLFKASELFSDLRIECDLSMVSEARLSQYREAEIALGYTLVGPHKDDFVFRSSDRDLSVYGSRGEQRMAVLALKMGEIYFIEEKVKTKVVLLLDDIFSELDEIHKREVKRVMVNRQVLATTADESDVEMFEKANLVRLP